MTEDTDPLVIGGAAANRQRTILSTVADEYLFDATEEAVTTSVVDPANVMMANVVLDPECTGSMPDDRSLDRRVGFNDNIYGRALSPAHKGNGNDAGDAVEFRFRESTKRVNITIDADRGGYSITHETKFMCIEPASLRDEPDIPELDLPATVRIQREAFVEALNSVAGGNGDKPDHVKLTADGEDFNVAAEMDSRDEGATVSGVANCPDDVSYSSLYSADYVRDIVKCIDKTKPEKVTIRLGSDFPVKIGFEFPDYGLDATFMLAPRIQSE